MIRVFVAALAPAWRAGLRALLATPDIQVVGEAPSLVGRALLDVDVLVVADSALLADVTPNLVGDEGVAVLALTDERAAAPVLRGLALRGWGILPPDATAPELRAAVTAIAQGLIVLGPAAAGAVLEQHGPADALDLGPLDEPLTPREQEVLELLSQGLSNKQIARALQISEHTVKFHVSAVYAKLGASSRADAVSRGARHGFLTL